MHRHPRRLTSLIAGIAACIASTAASATIIDFEALGPITSSSILVPSPYLEDGFRVQTTIGVPAFEGFVAYGPVGSFSNRYTGDVALINAFCCSNTRLTAQDGGPFSLLSIDLSENVPGDDSPNAVLLTGHKQGGGTVTQTINIDVTPFFPTMQTYTVNSDFTDLVAVTWNMGGPNFMQFDDIVVTTPEPPSLAIWLTALAGLGWVARRRLRRSAGF